MRRTEVEIAVRCAIINVDTLMDSGLPMAQAVIALRGCARGMMYGRAPKYARAYVNGYAARRLLETYGADAPDHKELRT